MSIRQDSIDRLSQLRQLAVRGEAGNTPTERHRIGMICDFAISKISHLDHVDEFDLEYAVVEGWQLYNALIDGLHAAKLNLRPKEGTTLMTQFPTFSADQFQTELAKRGQHPDERGFYNCPFHGPERTASFHITEQDGKGRGKCFGCGWSGDLIDAVKRLDGVSTKGALERLGEAPRTRKRTTNEQTKTSPTTDMHGDEKSQQRPDFGPVFQWIVANLPLDPIAEQYLHDHAIEMGEAKENGFRAVTFRAGSDVLAHMRGVFQDDLLMDARVMGKNEQTGALYFALANRLAIPWYGPQGNVTFIQGRTLADQGAKFISCGPAPTGLYVPGGCYPDRLHNEALHICEGAIDSLALHLRRGIRAVGAYNAGKTDLEPLTQQMVKAKRAGKLPGIVLALDNDTAGADARQRWLAALIAAGFPLESISEWKAPDGCKDMAGWLAQLKQKDVTAQRWEELKRDDPQAENQVEAILRAFPNAKIERVLEPREAV